MKGQEVAGGKDAEPDIGVIPPAPSTDELAILISEAPPYDADGQDFYPNGIAGKVSGVDNPERFSIVLYAKVDKWYVQPFVTSPYTKINSDGTWRNSTHSGMIYAALLVTKSFKPPATTFSLPGIGGNVVAIKEVAGKSR